MPSGKYLGFVFLCVFSTSLLRAQQLKLGKNPSVNLKSAVLELQSDNQGLLMVRIGDTAQINTLAPPDGMVIYFTPTKQLLVRASGYWQVLVQASSLTGTWALDGNSISAVKKFGTVTNYDLPFITNNTEQMRLSASGNLGVGASSFDASNPEKLLVQTGVTSSVNAIVAKGTINKYLQINVQNLSTGSSSSSDLVATANNGTETTNYVDLGINGQNFTSTGDVSTANDGYLISSGNDFYIINSNASKDVITLAGGTTSANEVMRATSSGKIGVGTAVPTAKLDVAGTFKLGAAGTVNKNQVSFAAAVPASTTAPASAMSVVLPNSYTPGIKDITIAIPTGNQPTTTQATVVVTPNFDLPGTVSIAFARLSATNQIKVRFINASTAAQAITGTLYFTVTEF